MIDEGFWNVSRCKYSRHDKMMTLTHPVTILFNVFSLTGELELKQEVKKLRMELNMKNQECDYLKKLLNNLDYKETKPKPKPKTPNVPDDEPRAKKHFDKLGNQQKRKVTDVLFDQIRAFAEERGAEVKHVVAYLLR